MLNATGKVVHNDLLVTLCLIPLLLTPSAASSAWSASSRGFPASSPRGAAYGWPIRAAMLIVGVAYLCVGLQKLRFSGLEWVTSDNLRYLLWASSDAQASPNAAALFIADRGWIAHLLAAGTLIVEIGFISCLRFPRLRWVFVPGVISLHLGIWLAMDLNYGPQAFAVALIFINWPAAVDAARLRLRGPPLLRPSATEGRQA